MITLLYRYRDVCNENGNLYLVEEEYIVLRTTPGGWWVCRNDGAYLSADLIAHRLKHKRDYGVRFVLSGAGKRYAYPTTYAALDSYRIRKAWQVDHAKRTLKRATLALAVSKRLLATGDDLEKNRWGERLMGNPFLFEAEV